MAVMKITFIFKKQTDMEQQMSFEHMVDDEEQAEELGKNDAKLLSAYMKGYGEGAE